MQKHRNWFRSYRRASMAKSSAWIKLRKALIWRFKILKSVIRNWRTIFNKSSLSNSKHNIWISFPKSIWRRLPFNPSSPTWSTTETNSRTRPQFCSRSSIMNSKLPRIRCKTFWEMAHKFTILMNSISTMTLPTLSCTISRWKTNLTALRSSRELIIRILLLMRLIR